MKKRKINPNYSHLIKSKLAGKRGAILEGSSRSGKTWSSIDFIIRLCARYETNCTINIIKETYNSFKTTLYDDFNARLPMFGLYSPFADVQEVATFKILGNKINLLGADKPSKFHGAGCDYFWINESLDVARDIFDQSEMRCRKFWWMDYNPKISRHYVYDAIAQRDDVAFLHTTWLNNPFISDTERNKILSYEPTEKNVTQGTADTYKWKVYGLGERADDEATIFKNWNTFDKPPDEYDFKVYGLDFGYTNDPTGVIEVIKHGNNLYMTELLYETGLTNQDIAKKLLPLIDKNTYIVADSAEPKSIKELQLAGLPVTPAVKGKDSIKHGIDRLNSYKLNLNKNSVNLLNEFRSYKWTKEKDGTIINVPVDKDNHLIDPARYAITKFNI